MSRILDILKTCIDNLNCDSPYCYEKDSGNKFFISTVKNYEKHMSNFKSINEYICGVYDLGVITPHKSSARFTLYRISDSPSLEIEYSCYRGPVNNAPRNKKIGGLEISRLEPRHLYYLETIGNWIFDKKRPTDSIDWTTAVGNKKIYNLCVQCGKGYNDPLLNSIIWEEGTIDLERNKISRNLHVSDYIGIVQFHDETKNKPEYGDIIVPGNRLSKSYVYEPSENKPQIPRYGFIIRSKKMDARSVVLIIHALLPKIAKNLDLRDINSPISESKMMIYLESNWFTTSIPEDILCASYDYLNADLDMTSAYEDYARLDAMISNYINHIKQTSDTSGSDSKPKVRDDVQILEQIRSRLSNCKHEVAKRLYLSDLGEIELCIKSKAYKASVVMCGSVLETFLIEWVSAVENNNYFLKDRLVRKGKEMLRADLIDYIDIVKGYKPGLDESSFQKADYIRVSRNNIHPKIGKNMYDAKKVSNNCLDNLSDVISLRYCIK